MSKLKSELKEFLEEKLGDYKSENKKYKENPNSIKYKIDGRNVVFENETIIEKSDLDEFYETYLDKFEVKLRAVKLESPIKYYYSEGNLFIEQIL